VSKFPNQTPDAGRFRLASLFKAQAMALLIAFTPGVGHAQCPSFGCLSGHDLGGGLTPPQKQPDTHHGGGLSPSPASEPPIRSLQPDRSGELLSLRNNEAYEENWLKEHNAEITMHYIIVIITMGGGGTMDEREVQDLVEQIGVHYQTLNSYKSQICAIEKQRGSLATECEQLALKIIHNPTYEVAPSDGTYRGAPTYVPATPNSDCEAGRTFSGYGCPVTR
jgi:hypothetical protein